MSKLHLWNTSAGTTVCGMSGTPLKNGAVLSPFDKVYHLAIGDDVTCKGCAGTWTRSHRWLREPAGTVNRKIEAQGWTITTRQISTWDKDGFGHDRMRHRYNTIRDGTGLIIGTGATRKQAYNEAMRFCECSNKKTASTGWKSGTASRSNVVSTMEQPSTARTPPENK